MSDKDTPPDKNKSRTLADFIPDEPEPERSRPRRRKPTSVEAEKLEALERAVRETEPDAVRRRARKSRDRSGGDLKDYYDNKGWKTKNRKRGGKGRFIFWAVVILFVVAFVLD